MGKTDLGASRVPGVISMAEVTADGEDVKPSESLAIDDLRIKAIRPLMPSACLIEDTPATTGVQQLVLSTRIEISSLLHEPSANDRLLVIVGPNTIHSPPAALEYAARLRLLAQKLEEDLLIVMRVNFEQSSSNDGWNGMINDPDMNGSNQINKGLRMARKLLVDINRLGLPAGTEYLDTISPQFVADLVSWASVGPQTTECKAYRELASGLSTPVGFHNNNNGDWSVAVHAVCGSLNPHAFLSVSKQGIAGIVETTGNSDCHVVLRGGAWGAMHTAPTLDSVCEALTSMQLPSRVLIDCGQSDAGSSPAAQARLAEQVAATVAHGNNKILGVMLHSFLLSGKQELVKDKALTYGMSVTEACMDWTATAGALEGLAAAVRQRRAGGTGSAAKRQRS